MRRFLLQPLSLLLIGVMLVHLAVLDWATGQVHPGLKTMPTPLFGRILYPTTAQPLEANHRPKPRNKAHRNTAPLVITPEPQLAPEVAAMSPEPLTESTPEPVIDAEMPASKEDAPPLSTAPQDTVTLNEGESWPVNTRLTYHLKGYYRGDLYGNAQVQWQRDDDSYQVQIDMRMALLLQASMISQGKVAGSGLIPGSYEESFLTRRSRVTIEGEEVRLNDGRTLPKPQGVQDTASQFVELSHRFANGSDTLKVGAEISIWLARPHGMDLWTYDVIAEDTLQTSELGAVQAFHLKPRPIANPRGSIVAELWFAPSLQYLPVRVMVVLGDGNYLDLIVKRIEQSSKTTALTKPEPSPIINSSDPVKATTCVPAAADIESEC